MFLWKLFGPRNGVICRVNDSSHQEVPKWAMKPADANMISVMSAATNWIRQSPILIALSRRRSGTTRPHSTDWFNAIVLLRVTLKVFMD